MAVFQRFLTLPPFPRGFHLVTHSILKHLPELEELRAGVLHIHILHTSASLTINENADPDVRRDMETIFNRLVPENHPDYVHTLEGSDDMPAHAKASLLGNSISVPVGQGQLILGTWQGVYLCEHRNKGGPRQLCLTLMGE